MWFFNKAYLRFYALMFSTVVAITIIFYLSGKKVKRKLEPLLSFFPDGKLNQSVLQCIFNAYFHNRRFKIVAWFGRRTGRHVRFIYYLKSNHNLIINKRQPLLDKSYFHSEIKSNNPNFDAKYRMYTRERQKVAFLTKVISQPTVQELVYKIFSRGWIYLRITREYVELFKNEINIVPEQVKDTLQILEFIVESLSQNDNQEHITHAQADLEAT